MIILCADTHLDERTWAARPTLVGDSMFSFAEIIRHAVEKKAEAVVCAGDMFDVRKPPSAVLKFFRQQMDILAEHEIPFYYIQGQHDLSSPTWASTVSDYPVLLDTAGIVELRSGVTLYGFSWTPVDQLSEKLAAVPDVDIFVCHQVWREFMGDHIPSENSLSNIPTVGTVFTGDFHSFRMQQIENFAADMLQVISPGSTNLRAINEPAEKYFVEVEVTPDFEMIFQRQKINIRYVLSESAVTDAELDGLLPKLAQAVKDAQHPVLGKPIVYMTISQKIPSGVRRVMHKIAEDSHVFFKFVAPPDEEEQIFDFEPMQEIDLANGVADCLSMVVPENHEMYQPLHRLLSASNFKIELLKLRDELLGKDDANQTSDT